MSQPIILSEGRDQQVLRGEKTETRRLAKEGDMMIGDTLRERSVRAVYRVGDTVAILPGRCKKSTGRARIAGVRLERLLDMTDESARAECCKDVEEYYRLWDSIQKQLPRGNRFYATSNPLVRVIKLERIDK